MEHIAYLNKKELIDNILSGKKTIESRWYKRRFNPWDDITVGEKIYFTLSGSKSVTAKAIVDKVIQYENYSLEKFNQILDEYGGRGNIYFSDPLPEVIKRFKGKKYCILIFLRNPEKVDPPLSIKKPGCNPRASWLYVHNIKLVEIDP